MPPASWERRHPERREFWSLDYFTPDGSLGGFVGLAFHPDRRRCWYWAALVGDERPYLLVRDLDVALPRLPMSREIRAEALWADMNCETPFEHWSFGLEAFGVAMEAPEEALRAERGERVGLGLDLEWEASAGITGEEGSYEQPGVVHGEVLVGGGGAGVETIAFEGHGWRRHTWGGPDGSGPGSAWMRAPRSWLAGRLDDGTPHRSTAVADDVEAELLHRAPLVMEGADGPLTLERWLCHFTDRRAGRGTGWVEWLRPMGSLGRPR